MSVSDNTWKSISKVKSIPIMNKIIYCDFFWSIKGSDNKQRKLARNKKKTKTKSILLERGGLSESKENTITTAKKNMYIYPAIP